jgi:hypothetical protein
MIARSMSSDDDHQSSCKGKILRFSGIAIATGAYFSKDRLLDIGPSASLPATRAFLPRSAQLPAWLFVSISPLRVSASMSLVLDHVTPYVNNVGPALVTLLCLVAPSPSAF